MDLFVVDRYMGDENSQAKDVKEEKESKQLSLLKKHIEKRKRSLASLDISTVEKPSETSKDSTKKTKRNKKKKTESSQPIETEREKDTEDLKQDYMGELSNDESGDIKDGEDARENKDHFQESDSERTSVEPSFTVIGGKKKKEILKVEKSLPDWLAKPTVIETDLSSNLLPVDKLSCLSSHIVKRLKALNIKSLFPIQKAVIPAILDVVLEGTLFCMGGDKPNDICVSAPTGSGKTLSYVVPIVQIIAKQPVCLLQALVLLPTKDLACQVKQVFEAFVEGTNIKVGLACGNKALAKEQESLIGERFGSCSRVNILVATPGRLVEHLSSTPHFTLQHLRFLVIDEADRLLDQSYHDWLNRVLNVTYQTQQKTIDPRTSLLDNKSIKMNLQTIREPPTALTPAELSKLQVPLQKLLFSATMTNSPEKLASLHLYNPVLYTASKAPEELGDSNERIKMFSRYTVPHGLEEYMVECNSGEKPLVLLYLIKENNLSGVLCFTSSLEATHRLFLLISHFGGIKAAEYSSSLNAQQRHGVLRDFRQGQIQLLICSDAMARGMDIDSVSYVISYDVPKFVKSYIHRVGRTARAGNKGTAYTLLYSEQVHHFKELIQKTGREKIPKYAIKDAELQPLVERYERALEQLEETVKSDKQTDNRRVKLKGQEEGALKKQK